MSLLGALVLSPSIATGQADSLAAVARSQYQEAMIVWRGGDVPLAREKLVHAVTAWPAQDAYLHAAESASAIPLTLRDGPTGSPP